MTILIGDRFGMLTVISDQPRKGKNRETFWLCQCDCGQETEVRRSNLVTGRSRSCGCQRGRKPSTPKSLEPKVVMPTWPVPPSCIK